MTDTKPEKTKPEKQLSFPYMNETTDLAEYPAKDGATTQAAYEGGAVIQLVECCPTCVRSYQRITSLESLVETLQTQNDLLRTNRKLRQRLMDNYTELIKAQETRHTKELNLLMGKLRNAESRIADLERGED